MSIPEQFEMLRKSCTKLTSQLNSCEYGIGSWYDFLVDNCKEVYTILHVMGLTEYMQKNPEELKKILNKINLC